MSDLRSLKNIGPKVEEHLALAEIYDAETLRAVGSVEATRRIFLNGEVKPHIMFFYCLEAAIQDRGIFSFDPHEKAELKMLYAEMLEGIQ